MKLNLLMAMIAEVKRETKAMRTKGDTIADIGFNITENVTFDYFWDYATDMPTVDVEQLEIAITNTVRNLLKPLDKSASA